ncbi:hypothetical protein GFL49_05035 [Rhizobium leguminosarum bv. viciae]|nr:hypothetical protein [Rhizobium leguminosarum bv. viciae]
MRRLWASLMGVLGMSSFFKAVADKTACQPLGVSLADIVGRGAVGATALAWANPSTGSAGVIGQIDASTDGPDGCRGFVTSRQSLDGMTRFNGVACPSGTVGNWVGNRVALYARSRVKGIFAVLSPGEATSLDCTGTRIKDDRCCFTATASRSQRSRCR